ncbi:SAM-dependent methyltransferase [Streptomyces sp. NPDC090994]|uniref:SAM-dependent methyltransferase n=1 Tax=Streptomyces sp. NPDC090994 TaxID=3365969 RepID=UPI00380CE1C0
MTSAPQPDTAVDAERGWLNVVGTGYRSVSDITLEGRASIEQADQVFYLVTDPVTAGWIVEQNPRAENLQPLYRDKKPRVESYSEMTERILRPVRAGRFVTAAFYGHPGVFVAPSHAAIKQAKKEGFSAHMLPAVSAEDWLFADLGLDPASSGCQSFEATDFLVNQRQHDPTSLLILWQIGVIGALDFRWRYDYRANLAVLTETLLKEYPEEHQVAVYQIMPYAICTPWIRWVELRTLAEAEVTPSCTLVVPPRGRRVSDPEMLERLGMPLYSDSYRTVAREGVAAGTEIPLSDGDS